MAVLGTPNVKLSNFGASATQQTTDPWVPLADTVYFLLVAAGRTDGLSTAPVSLVGNGNFIWNLIDTQAQDNGNVTLAAYWGISTSPVSGSLVMSWPTAHNATWYIVEQSAADRDIAVTQSNSATNINTTDISVLLNTLEVGASTFIFSAINSTSATVTLEAGYFPLGTQLTNTVPSMKVALAYNPSGDATPSVTYSSTNIKTMIAFEINPAADGGTLGTWTYGREVRIGG
jgi:hypothetical protein